MHIWMIMRKDLTLQFRQPTAFLSTFMFCLLLVFIFSLSLHLSSLDSFPLLPAILWIILLFAAVLGITHTFVQENDNDCIHALALAVSEKSCIFLGKGLANFAFLLMTVPLLVLILFLFLDITEVINLPLLVLSLFLGVLGLAVLGTLFNSLFCNQAGLLMPILLFSLAIPLLISAIELTKVALALTTQLQPWLLLIVIFDLLFIALGILLSDYMLEV